MVEIINKSVCRGVAGRRANSTPYGIVIHNTADDGTAKQHMNRLAGYTNKQLEAGFAHYYIDESTIIRTEDTYNKAWHTANTDGNANYVGYEVCRSTGDEKTFLQAEQNTFMQIAEDFKEWGKTPTRENVRLHKEFVATACPHRSWDLHGKSTNAVKDYFISQIKKYMSAGTTTVAKPAATTPKHYIVTGWYTNGVGASNTVSAYLKANNMAYKTRLEGAKIWYEVGWFNQQSNAKRQLEDWLISKGYSYQVVTENNVKVK